MKTSPWGHQTAAAEFCVGRRASVLQMGMGTGKSRVAIDLWERWKPPLTLIVAPKRVMRVWPKQFEIHSECDPVIVVLDKGTTAAKKRKACSSRVDILVVNYEAYWRGELGEALLAAAPDLVVMDEIHKIKSPTGKASKFARTLSPRAGHVLGLSGTLMPHSPLDAWAIGAAIDPTVLGRSYTVHRNTYAVVQKLMVGGKERPIVRGYRNTELLGQKLSEFCFHVDRDVLDLPEAMHEVVECSLGKRAMQIYEPLHAGFAAECAVGVINLAHAAVKFTRLQQLTGGWAVVDAEAAERVDDSKQLALMDLLENAPGERFVVFCRFHRDLDAIHKAAGDAGTPSYELSGRADELDDWDGAGGVLAAQIQSGGTGIDLTAARYCVFYSVGSLGDYEQALARVHRPGQTRPVTYYHLVCPDTVDEAIYDALANRREVIQSVIESMKENGDGESKGREESDARETA